MFVPKKPTTFPGTNPCNEMKAAQHQRLLVKIMRETKLFCFKPAQNVKEINEYAMFIQNIARIANAVPVTLYSRVTMNAESFVPNCHKCNQCLKGHKYLGLLFEGFLLMSLSLSILVRSCLLIILIKCLKGQKSLGSLFEGVF